MILADWIAIAVVAAFILIGALVGFGKGLKFFTGGIFGIIISILVCYLVGGLVLEIPFVHDILEKFIQALTDKNKFCDSYRNYRLLYNTVHYCFGFARSHSVPVKTHYGNKQSRI